MTALKYEALALTAASEIEITDGGIKQELQPEKTVSGFWLLPLALQ